MNSSLLDGLTGLYNHAYFKRFLELEIKRSRRQGHHTSLLMIDLDNFKKINDTLGHMAGDEILRQVSGLIKDSIREIDVAARYGGEEFVVVLPYGAGQSIETVGERIRSLMEGQTFAVPGSEEGQSVTVSIGGAVFPTDADTADKLILTADRMFYNAKREGKNRVIICDTVAAAPVAMTVSA